jgi:hypothetical protein
MAWRLISKSTIAALHALTPDEQTRLTWAKAIESYDAVPDVYKDFFGPYLADGRKFPYVVLTPSSKGIIRRTNEKLICDFGDEIDILERGGNSFSAKHFPLDGISYVEFGSVLLDAWIKISGVASDGISTSSTLKFNSVTDYLFTPILERIRSATTGAKGVAASSELDKFNHLVRINYKFMSYAKRSLVAGEKVLQTVLQPEIHSRELTIRGKTYYTTISPTLMMILTDLELIIIREDARWSEEVNYGGIWDYIPLNKIASLSLSKKGSNLLVLSVHLPDNTRLDFVFQASAKPEINALLDEFERLSPVLQNIH